jgi:hypothetical protein
MALPNVFDVSPPVSDTSHNTPSSQAWSHISSTVWAAPSTQKIGYGQPAPWSPPSENPTGATVVPVNPIQWNSPAPWKPSQAVLPNPEANSIANPAPVATGSDKTTNLPPDVTIPETMGALDSAVGAALQFSVACMMRSPLASNIFKVCAGIDVAVSLSHAGNAYESASLHHDTWSDLVKLERQDLAHRADWFKSEYKQLKAKF